VCSGYKAGLRYCVFPEKSVPEEYASGLKTKWLVDNWGQWGYIDCPVDEVRIVENIEPFSLD
jgi:hypothetical protein